MLSLYSPIHTYASSPIELETILYNSPNIEASEFILIRNNNLELSISYIEKAMSQISKNTEPELIKNIRKTHLYFLSAFAYTYHITSSKQKTSKSNNTFTAINKTVNLGNKIIEEIPNYSDIYRILSTCMMLSAKHGLVGISKFLLYQKTALQYIQKAIELNTYNPMARVTLSNFDALGNFIVGSNKQRGRKTIFIPIHSSWPKVYKFEFLNSQAIVHKKDNNKDKYKETIQAMKKLYQESYRYTQLENY